jgi:23S rRNA (adenine2030-N6)-methyltransferase
MSSKNYQHEHHAGNHGDVFKHVVLVSVLQKMQAQHPDGIVLVDTHSGSGFYDLKTQDQTQDPAEYKKGIVKVIEKKESAPKPVQDYIKISMGWSTAVEDIEYYPGSPVLGQKLIRAQDEHRLSDLNVIGMEGLKEKQSHFQQLDAFDPASVDYFVGGTNKHCVVLIDPPYQESDDYAKAKNLMERILDAKPTATVMVWVPLIHGSRFRFEALKMLKEVATKKAAIGQYTGTVSVGAEKLMGSIMFVANPTPGLDELLGVETLNWLSRTMTNWKGDYSVEQKMKKKKKPT